METLEPTSSFSSVSWDRDSHELPQNSLSPISFNGKGCSTTLLYGGSVGNSELSHQQSLLALTPEYVLLGYLCYQFQQHQRATTYQTKCDDWSFVFSFKGMKLELTHGFSGIQILQGGKNRVCLSCLESSSLVPKPSLFYLLLSPNCLAYTMDYNKMDLFFVFQT